jgi:putative DNA primase/helicase
MSNLSLIKSNLLQNAIIIKNLDDFGLVERIVDTNINNLLYLVKSKYFVIWNGMTWEKCENNKLGSIIKNVINTIPAEIATSTAIARTESGEIVTVNKLKQFHDRVSRASTLKSIISLLPTCEKIVEKEEAFDTETDHIVTQNGILNLKTGYLCNHYPQYKSTRIAAVQYKENITCPEFNTFLNQIFNNDQSLIEYVQVLLGYFLTGSTSEQKLYILFGNGSNGKTKLLNVIQNILNSYAVNTPSSTLLKKPVSSIPCDIPRLNKARVVVASESNLGVDFDMATIKLLTGGDQVTGRSLYKEYQSYIPQFKIVFATNILPDIKSVDYGTRRRIEIIPFKNTFKGDSDDKNLEGKLMKEATGIFAWMVEGAKKYYESRFPKCKAVQDATDEYFNHSDNIQSFLDDTCDINTNNATYHISVADLWALSNIWTNKNGIDPYSKKEFSRLIQMKGFQQNKSGSVRRWKGIRIKSKLHSKP